MKPVEVADSGEFACWYCPKKFSSAKARGGHQNAHRRNRARDLPEIARDAESSETRGGTNQGPADPISVQGDLVRFNAVNPNNNLCMWTNGNNSSWSGVDREKTLEMLLCHVKTGHGLPEKVGVRHKVAKNKVVMESDVGGSGENYENLDLTLRL